MRRRDHFVLGIYLQGEVGVNLRTIGATASAVKAPELSGPESAQCPAIAGYSKTGAGKDIVYRIPIPYILKHVCIV